MCFVYFYSHYFFASITAHVSAMYAPFLAVSLALGMPPLLAALVLGFSSNLFASLTHYGTAPAPILFGSGHVHAWHVVEGRRHRQRDQYRHLDRRGAAWWRLLGLW